VIAAAILHDTVEDTQTSPAEFAARFGPKISAIVAEVTDDKSLPKAERKRLQIEHAAEASPEAQLVKLADKISATSTRCPRRTGRSIGSGSISAVRRRWSTGSAIGMPPSLASLTKPTPGGREFSSRRSRRLASAGSRRSPPRPGAARKNVNGWPFRPFKSSQGRSLSTQ
jgi:hypothetical protein